MLIVSALPRLGLPTTAPTADEIAKAVIRQMPVIVPTPPVVSAKILPTVLETDVFNGPYTPEEIRKLILLVGELDDYVTQNGIPIFTSLRDLQQNWVSKFMESDAGIKEAGDLLSRTETFETGIKDKLKATGRYYTEVEPTVRNGGQVPVFQGIIEALDGLGNNANALKGEGYQMRYEILRKDASRLSASTNIYEIWLGKSQANLTTKIRRLRDYKSTP
jgi:hypothetical protein